MLKLSEVLLPKKMNFEQLMDGLSMSATIVMLIVKTLKADVIVALLLVIVVLLSLWSRYG